MIIIITFIMSFGQYQYQHRFHKKQPSKRPAIYSPIDNYVLPNNARPMPYYTPQIVRHQPLSNQLNLKVRAGNIGYNQPGWEGYKLKSYVTDKYSQDYQGEQETIQRFRRDAEQFRKRLRMPYIASREAYNEQNSRVNRIYTEPPAEIEERLPNIQQNPQRYDQTDKFDVGVMARMRGMSQGNEKDLEEIERSRKKEKKKMREYEKKYNKLKNQLKYHLRKERDYEEQLQSKKREEMMKQQLKMGQLQNLLYQVSKKVANNSIIFNQSLRVEKELREMRQAPTHDQKQQLMSHKSFGNSIKSHYITTDPTPLVIEQYSPKLPTPKVVYNPRSSPQSYGQLSALRQQIRSIDNKIKQYSST